MLVHKYIIKTEEENVMLQASDIISSLIVGDCTYKYFMTWITT